MLCELKAEHTSLRSVLSFNIANYSNESTDLRPEFFLDPEQYCILSKLIAKTDL